MNNEVVVKIGMQSFNILIGGSSIWAVGEVRDEIVCAYYSKKRSYVNSTGNKKSQR